MSYRNIVVGNEVYQYRIGKSNAIIRKDDKRFSLVDFSKLTGQDWSSIEHEQYKGNFHVTPQQIKDHIGGMLCDCN